MEKDSVKNIKLTLRKSIELKKRRRQGDYICLYFHFSFRNGTSSDQIKQKDKQSENFQI